MNPRLAAAAAATSVLAVVVFAPAAAQAAPPAAPTAPGQCTLAEWQNPLNALRCVRAEKGAIDHAASCLQAPTPAAPDAGFAGMVAVRPDADLYGGVGGQYTDYGAAGYGLSTYGLGCAADVTHATAVAQNGMASTIMQWDAGWVAFANTGRGYAYNPTRMWGWFDTYLDDAVHQLYEHVWLTMAALFVALTGVSIIAMAHRGSLPDAVKVAGWALLVTVVTTVAVQWPSLSARLADTGATTVLEAVHSTAGLGPADVKPGKCVLGADACVDHRSPSDRISDNITTALLYRSWLDCELGSSTSPTAKKYGAALFDAQVLTWQQSADIQAHPELRTIIFQEKAEQWDDLAAVIKVEDPTAYEYLQGLHGSDRLFTAIMTSIAVLAFNSFDLIASLVMILGFGMFRLVLISMPITGTFGVLDRTSGYWRRTLAAFVGAFQNIVAFGVASTVYLFLIDLYWSIDVLPDVMKIVLMGVTSFAAWAAVRPVRGLLRGFGTDTSRVPRGPVTWLLVKGGTYLAERRHTDYSHTGQTTTRPQQPGTAVQVAPRAESFRSVSR